MIKSKALEVNLVNYHVDVSIDARYHCIQEINSNYAGLSKSLNIVLRELGHPYKNWKFITHEIITYALDYFYLFKAHNSGVVAAKTIVEILIEAIESDTNPKVSSSAADSLIRYINCIILESETHFPQFAPVVNYAFSWMKSSKVGHFTFFIKSSYSLKKLIKLFTDYSDEDYLQYTTLNGVLARYLRSTYVYWLKVKDPLTWVEENVETFKSKESIRSLLKEISHKYIKKHSENISDIKNIDFIFESNAKSVMNKLIDFPDHLFFINQYRKLPQLFVSNIDNPNSNKWKILFLFHTMNITGLSLIHEDLLMDINRTVSWLIDNERSDYIKQLVDKTFITLKKSSKKFPHTTFSCILTMGRGIYKTDQIELVELFIENVVKLGFQTPGIHGVGDDWQLRANTAHIKNIRTWLELIKLKPKWSKKLISSLIIHLSVSGVLIKDTYLFPKDITGFLNSDIAPVYNLSKQLARLFPTYFIDIGAEGILRDISTKLDEITHRQDVLIHFLRKQSHVESSNRIIAFIEAVIKFWETKTKKCLKPFVPPLIFSQIENDGAYVDGVNKLLLSLKAEGIKLPEDLLLGMDGRVLNIISNVSGVDSVDIERISLIVDFYKLLHDKYNIDFRALRHHIKQLTREGFPNLYKLSEAIDKKDIQEQISCLLDFIHDLKLVITSRRKYKKKSEIYKKRHFTIGIPSTYGSYYEFKFAALGLSFRAESLINVLFEELNVKTNLDLVTKTTFYQVYDNLKLFEKALKIDGIYSVEFEQQLNFLLHSLEIREFTFTQYMDVFKGFTQSVKNMMNDYLHNVHGQNLTKILSELDTNLILTKYFPNKTNYTKYDISYRVSEIFFRDRIATSLGIQQLDVYLTKVYNAISNYHSKLMKEELQLLLKYNPEHAIVPLNRVKSSANSIIYMGSKGINMQKLHNLGLPTPPCFIVTTEAFKCRNLIKNFIPVRNDFKNQVTSYVKQLERTTGKKLGDACNPMLLSVRSGSSVSQPGMMDTLVNVGLNIKLVDAIAQKKHSAWFAWDSYRRFLGCYGMAFGIERSNFDDIVNECKSLFKVNHKKELTSDQIKFLALSYRDYIEKNGIHIPDDPFEQLYAAISIVFDSWESKKARAYRSIMGISDDWGTAVVIQDMVFGNLSRTSGSGVFFTHNPRWSGDTMNLWGDFTIGGQGEDVVSGLVKTFPISIKQKKAETRNTNITLETHFPEIYTTIRKWANTLVYKKGWGPQEMEFTFESPLSKDLYLLQTRDMSIRERTSVLRFKPYSKHIGVKQNKHLGTGIGVSGGAMSGRIVFTQEEINYWRKKEPNGSLILLRRDTTPDDIREIFAADGLLTVKGGVTSHASVVAHRLGKTCVVGCPNLVCDDRKKLGIFGNLVVNTGDFMSIDGYTGSVFLGKRSVNLD